MRIPPLLKHLDTVSGFTSFQACDIHRIVVGRLIEPATSDTELHVSIEART